ncbi:MAG: transglycosylase SLT domain-containing protein [Chitinispirillales bacterium]|jgi:soluble lytic murein transglycosylase|nr:transglycosylase SLT domain-containing protein [Chitinispirillales bacterium]
MRPNQNGANAKGGRAYKPGIMFVGNKVWISELFSIVFICFLLIILLSISFIISRNAIAIHNLDKEIAVLKTEKVNSDHYIKGLREKNRLFKLMSAAAGKKVSEPIVRQLTDLVYQNSLQYGYNPELLLAVIHVESRFDPRALGRYRSGNLSGALGLMQVKYETALDVAKPLGIKNLKPEDLFDPEINLVLGTAYLTQLITRFKSFKLGILAYNLGPGTVRSTLSRKEQLPTRYYEKVLAQYYKLREMGKAEEELQ